MRHFSISPCNTVWDLLATHATWGLMWTFDPYQNTYYVEHQASDPTQLEKETKTWKKRTKRIRKLNTDIVSAISLSPNPQSNPTHCPKGPVKLAAPKLLFDFWEVLFFSPQGLGQRPGAAGGLQVLGLIRAVAALLLIRIDVDAVHASEEQQQSQDDYDWRIKIAHPELICSTIRKEVLPEILLRSRHCLNGYIITLYEPHGEL